MEPSVRNRAGYVPAVAALVSIHCLSVPASAQVANGHSSVDVTAPGSRGDADPKRTKTSDLFIVTHDVSGKLGTPLQLAVKLVRTGEVSIEAIYLLGLPRGMTISDATNIFSPSEDKSDVNISAWDLPNIQIMQIDEHESSFSLAVAAVWSAVPGGQVNVATSLLNVSFLPDGPDRTVAAGGGARSPEQPAAATRGAPSSPPALASAAAPVASVTTEGVVMPLARGGPLKNTAVVEHSGSAAVTERRPAAESAAARRARPVEGARPTAHVDPLVERARALIQLGDISGARLLLERAQARHAPNATFLLAQTWDPAMLRRWNVHGMRADPDLARSLYAKAADQDQTDEQLLAAGR